MPRFYVGKLEGDKEVWHAQNATAEGNFVVTFDLAFDAPGDDIGKRYRAAIAAIGETAGTRRELSSFTWLFALESRLNDVFQVLVDHLGVEHHSYTVVNLKSGEGLSYDAEKRMVCEFYSQNWMA